MTNLPDESADITDGLDLTADEIQDIIAGLRKSESSSRKSFGYWLVNNLDNDSPQATEKILRAKAAFARLVKLRAKFGDTKPVKVE